MRITFRKGRRYCGRMRLPETFEIRLNGEKLGTIQRHDSGLWFWYGGGHNSLWSSKPKSLEECKAKAIAYFTALRSQKGGGECQ